MINVFYMFLLISNDKLTIRIAELYLFIIYIMIFSDSWN